MNSDIIVGCDMAKSSFHYCVLVDGKVEQQGVVHNFESEIACWLTELQSRYSSDQLLLGVEHTGIYNALLLRVAAESKIRICVSSAREIKLSLGLQRGKTDKVDAARISEYMLRFPDRLKLWKPRRAIVEKLGNLLAARRRLVNAKKQLSTINKDAKRFMTKEQSQVLVASCASSVAAIKADIKQIEKNLSTLVSSDDYLTYLHKRATSVTGVGKITSWHMINLTNEFKSFENAKKIACMVGVAPFEYTSGSSIRGRSRVSHNARKELKTLLHLCAMAAISKKGELQDYYLRKVAEGKNKMSVLNAVRNKIVRRIFATIRDDTMYDQSYAY